jgi:AraC-like DNA-binding protein
VRLDPAPDLAAMLERHWIVRWDLRGREPYLSETLPYPSCHLVIEAGRSAVYGVGTERFTRLLEGRGEAFGTKFQPGAFAPLSRIPMVELAGRTVAPADALGPAAASLEERVLAADGDRERAGVMEDFLRSLLPDPDPRVELVQRIAESMLASPEGTRVDEIAAEHAMSQRTLQALFRRYVGVTPKWVLKRYRLHSAAERIAEGETDLARLALDLGYFDQSHFIRDFKGLVGRAPAAYAEECARAREMPAA